MSAERPVHVRLSSAALFALAVVVVVVEEFVWRHVTRLGEWLSARLPLFAAAERLVDRLSPRWTFAVFAIPLVSLVPIKLAAVSLMVHGHVVSGVALIVAAKVAGTAVSARLFAIAKPKLMQVPAFVRVYGAVTRWVDRVHEHLDQSPSWQSARRLAARARAAAAGLRHRDGWLGRKFGAAVRMARRG
jgi:hypothetical protein